MSFPSHYSFCLLSFSCQVLPSSLLHAFSASPQALSRFSHVFRGISSWHAESTTVSLDSEWPAWSFACTSWWFLFKQVPVWLHSCTTLLIKSICDVSVEDLCVVLISLLSPCLHTTHRSEQSYRSREPISAATRSPPFFAQQQILRWLLIWVFLEHRY